MFAGGHFGIVRETHKQLNNSNRFWEGEAPAEPLEMPGLSATPAARQEPRPPRILPESLEKEELPFVNPQKGNNIVKAARRAIFAQRNIWYADIFVTFPNYQGGSKNVRFH